jgi:FtsP/CotA-like multicopper oxidase with cupredoxin domain
VNAASVQQPFIRIGTDGNLLPRPLHNHRKIEISPAERADIVFNFSVYPIGTELFLIDRQIQLDTRGPAGVSLAGRQVLKIIVDREPPEVDVSRVPLLLRGLPTISAAELASAPVRSFAFDRTNGQWSINNQLFDVENPSVVVQKGSYEIWELANPSGGWHHPIHIHLEEGRVLSMVNIETGVQIPIPPENQGRRDVYVLPPNTSMRVFIRFRDWPGKYVMHCHNLVHEDHAMMLRYDITA